MKTVELGRVVHALLSVRDSRDRSPHMSLCLREHIAPLALSVARAHPLKWVASAQNKGGEDYQQCLHIWNASLIASDGARLHAIPLFGTRYSFLRNGQYTLQRGGMMSIVLPENLYHDFTEFFVEGEGAVKTAFDLFTAKAIPEDEYGIDGPAIYVMGIPIKAEFLVAALLPWLQDEDAGIVRAERRNLIGSAGQYIRFTYDDHMAIVMEATTA